jgi:hypothetical protein
MFQQTDAFAGLAQMRKNILEEIDQVRLQPQEI